MEKNKGTVVWFDKAKGIGFIKPDEGDKDFFFHYSNIVMDGFKALETDQRVTFVVGANHLGPQAEQVESVTE